MLLILLTALAVGIVAWPGRTARARLVWALAFLVLLAPNWWMEARWLRTQAAASEVVRALSGRPEAYAQCQRFSGAFFYARAATGWVEYGEDGSTSPEAWLTYETCQRIRDWREGGRSAPTEQQVVAVHVLTHEAMHVKGERSEAVAECMAMQADARTVVLLGATRAQATALAQRYWSEVYPRLSDGYRTGDCRPDGPLDQAPGDGAWP